MNFIPSSWFSRSASADRAFYWGEDELPAVPVRQGGDSFPEFRGSQRLFEHQSFPLPLAFKNLSLHFLLTLVPLKLKRIAAPEPQHPKT